MVHPFNLTISALAGKTHVPFVKKHLKQAANLMKGTLRELSIVFVGDSRMSELHGQFMDMYTPTDVLTFPIDEDARQRPVSGEVYVCIPEARRQAKARGTQVAHEVLLYSLHGMLHLSGFDDRTASDYRKMHRTEDRILTRLGIGRVFASVSCGATRTAVPKVPKRRLPLAAPKARGVNE